MRYSRCREWEKGSPCLEFEEPWSWQAGVASSGDRCRAILERKALCDSRIGAPLLAKESRGCGSRLLDSARRFVRIGASVWDVGANCGLFTFAAAHLAGSGGYVLAVEPDTFLASLLNRSSAAATPDTADTDVLVCAVSDTVGVADLGIAARGRSANAIGVGRSQTGGFRGTQSTVTVTLDWLAERFRRPDVIKIDVEGHELRVLEGGSEVSEAGPANSSH